MARVTRSPSGLVLRMPPPESETPGTVASLEASRQGAPAAAVQPSDAGTANPKQARDLPFGKPPNVTKGKVPADLGWDGFQTHLKQGLEFLVPEGKDRRRCRSRESRVAAVSPNAGTTSAVNSGRMAIRKRGI